MSKMIDLVEFHSFLPSALPKDGVVVDLGANRGRFSGKMASRYGARCYAVEAHPGIFESLKANSDAECFHFAITDRVGTVPIKLSDNLLAATIVSEATGGRVAEVPCIDLEGFVAQAGISRIDLLKVDIEGAELPMLAACSDDFLRSIPQITVEFHDFCGMTPEREVRAAISRLEALGFFAVRFSRIGHQDTLLINTAHIPLSWPQRLYIKHLYRNLKGAARILRKRIYGKKWARGYS